ncbi:poliovirus receptor-like isoform X1 [Chionomys nivalis]|uniref:poliovirus receptor-like isoform X1 n=1 Tax=Chionomys nivalis TaxID=269649 RepID=UPI002598BB3E|nr:poliovirus receptor-like isoform X1 [Chionomys nivalis]XP_057618007.1 poliovirus receptor-like isoform X1 [Chionomys nivalis]
MNRHTPLAWSPRLLLPGLLLLLLPDRAKAASGIAVQVLTNVTGFLNEPTTLLCNLMSAENVTVTQVTWMKKNPDGSRPTVAVFHPTKGPSIPDSERVMFLAPKLDGHPWNASLVISHVRAEDEGSYECQFATFPTGSRSNSVHLRVLARPTNTAEALTPSPTWKLQDLAKCISTGGRPPPQISWLSDLKGSETRETTELGPQPGTFTVTSFLSSMPSSHADGKNITCSVKHESVQEPELLLVTLSVPYPPEVSISGYDEEWPEGLTGVALSCDARSKPEPTDYEWSTTTGPLPNNTEAQGNRLLIHKVNKTTINNVTFVCNVTNALGSGQNQVTVHVKEPMSSGLGTAAIIFISIGISIGILAVIGLWYYCVRSRRSRSDSKSDSRPSKEAYSPVNNNINSTQDIEMNSINSHDQRT